MDRCAGMKKDVEKQILHDNKKEKKVVVKIDKKLKKYDRVHRITCELYADPHVHGFNKKDFNAQTLGDWVLYRGKHLSAHYRGKSFGSWVGPVKYGVRLYDHKIYSVGFDLSKLRINGKIRTILEGELKLNGKGGIIRKNKNTITFSTNHGEEVDFISFGWFYNSYVRSNRRHVTGVCSQKFIKSKFFHNPHHGKRITITKVKCPNKKEFIHRCKNRKLNGKKLKFCVADLCNGLPVRIEKQILKKK